MTVTERPLVLVVDDEDLVREATTRMLADEYRVVQAESAEDALEKLPKLSDLAVIISDQRMPGKSGTELLDVVREQRPEVARIMLTASRDSVDMLSAINSSHVFCYLTKPIREEALLEAVRRLAPPVADGDAGQPTSGYGGKERREHIRLPSWLPVNYELLSGDGEPVDAEIRTGFTRAVSRRGMCLQLGPLPGALGTRLEAHPWDFKIRVHVNPAGRSLQLAGHVRWCESIEQSITEGRGRLVGVEFDADERQQLLLEQQVQADLSRRRRKTYALAGVMALAIALVWLRC